MPIRKHVGQVGWVDQCVLENLRVGCIEGMMFWPALCLALPDVFVIRNKGSAHLTALGERRRYTLCLAKAKSRYQPSPWMVIPATLLGVEIALCDSLIYRSFCFFEIAPFSSFDFVGLIWLIRDWLIDWLIWCGVILGHFGLSLMRDNEVICRFRVIRMWCCESVWVTGPSRADRDQIRLVHRGLKCECVSQRRFLTRWPRTHLWFNRLCITVSGQVFVSHLLVASFPSVNIVAFICA